VPNFGASTFLRIGAQHKQPCNSKPRCGEHDRLRGDQHVAATVTPAQVLAGACTPRRGNGSIQQHGAVCAKAATTGELSGGTARAGTLPACGRLHHSSARRD
jgi:hypothetical protein